MYVIVVSNPGKAWFLKLLLKDTVPADYPFYLGLWRNNVAPIPDTDLAALGRATYTGYADVALPRTGWTNPVVTGLIAQSVWSSGFVPFFATGGSQLIYGWMLLDPTASLLLLSERFSAPVTVSTINAAYVMPIIRLTG
jgi:hypothetical protein